jgi:uncharacterized protein
MSLIDRQYKEKSLRLAREYPCLAILGPRQCGKTTFVKNCFPNFEYLDLELPSDLSKIENDPELFLSSRTKPIIIDEAQRMPELFPVLRALIDRDRKNFGKFILLGSTSFQLHKNINESLSGRVAFVDFAPLNCLETKEHFSFDSLWLKGGFPDALINKDGAELNFEWFEFYTRTLIERDLPSLGIDVDQRQFRLLWKMAAHFHGELLNKNKIASSLGISPHTVDRYLGILEQTFALRLLPPYYQNLKKRLVKSPKLYLRDSGIFHYFRNIKSFEDLTASPDLGNSFEGMVVEQICQICGLEWTPYFIRTSDGLESDLLLSQGETLVPIEIKSKQSPDKNDAKSIEKLLDILDQPKGYVVGRSDDTYPISERITCIGINHWIEAGCNKFWE